VVAPAVRRAHDGFPSIMLQVLRREFSTISRSELWKCGIFYGKTGGTACCEGPSRHDGSASGGTISEMKEGRSGGRTALHLSRREWLRVAERAGRVRRASYGICRIERQEAITGRTVTRSGGSEDCSDENGSRLGAKCGNLSHRNTSDQLPAH